MRPCPRRCDTGGKAARPWRACRPRSTGPLGGWTSAGASSLWGPVVAGFDGADAVHERFPEDASSDAREHDSQEVALSVLALAGDGDVDHGGPVRCPSEGVDVARGAAPDVRVRRGEDDAVGVGPVVVQPLPDPARSLGDVCVGGSDAVSLQVVVRAVAEDLVAAGTEVGETRDVLAGSEGGGLVQADRGHECPLRVGGMRGCQPAAQKPQWCATEKCWSSWDWGESSDTIAELALNVGQRRAAVPGRPVAANAA